MTRDSLSRLIARSYGMAEVIQPVLPSRFEPVGRVPLPGWMGSGKDEDSETAEPASPGKPLLATPTQGGVAAKGRGVERERSRVTAPEMAPDEAVGPYDTNPSPASALGVAPRRDSVPSTNLPDAAQPPGQRPVRERKYSEVVPSAPAFVTTQRTGPHQPLNLTREGGRTTRDITPPEIRVRTPEVAGPKADPGAEGSGTGASVERTVGERKVTVHIGRIEVRAVLSPASQPERRRPVDSRQRLSLSDYLKKKEKGAQ